MKKSEFKPEDLIINLPDYVMNRIDNEEITKAIESELKKNTEFREEYISLKNTLGFLNNAELPVPDDIYFASLSAGINQRIENESQSPERLSAGELFKKYLKILVPVFSIVVIAFIIYLYLINGNEKETIVTGNKIETPQKTLSDNTSRNNNQIPEVSQNKVLTDSVKSGKLELKRKSSKRNLALVEETVKENPDTLLTDQTDEFKNEIFADIFSEEEEINEESENYEIEILNLDYPAESDPEEEFEEFTPEEQQEIINGLIKSKI